MSGQVKGCTGRGLEGPSPGASVLAELGPAPPSSGPCPCERVLDLGALSSVPVGFSRRLAHGAGPVASSQGWGVAWPFLWPGAIEAPT